MNGFILTISLILSSIVALAGESQKKKKDVSLFSFFFDFHSFRHTHSLRSKNIDIRKKGVILQNELVFAIIVITELLNTLSWPLLSNQKRKTTRELQMNWSSSIEISRKTYRQFVMLK